LLELESPLPSFYLFIYLFIYFIFGSLAAGFIAGLLKGWPQDECVQLALRSAQCSLRSTPAVPEALAGVATPRRR